jgi:hypothetical protein
MRSLRVVFPVLLLSLVAAQSSAGDRALGPMSITGDQTIFLHFIGNGAATDRPFPVAVHFFDAAGALVASSSGGCPPGQDVCPPTEFVQVDSKRVTTVSLSGAALGLAPGETMTIQPLVTSFSPGIVHLLTTVDFVHANSAARVTLRFDPRVLARPISRPRFTLGPILLGAGELARFHVGQYGKGIVAFNMFFVNASGDHIGTGKAVRIGALGSETIELDGDATDIAGVPGVILGGTNAFGDEPLTASLEIIDKTTGAVKAVLSSGGAGTGGFAGTGNGGGGGGAAH